MSATVYVEGGSDKDTKALRTQCRRAFSEFFGKAGLTGRLPKVFACGGRQRMQLKRSDGWDRPRSAPDSAAHLMVQRMESWFYADKESLAGFFGEGSTATPCQLLLQKTSRRQVLTEA